MSSAGGRPSWQAMVSVRTSIVPPGLSCHPPTRRAHHLPLRHHRSQPSLHEFAGSVALRLTRTTAQRVATTLRPNTR
jgi:hypothetical protein